MPGTHQLLKKCFLNWTIESEEEHSRQGNKHTHGHQEQWAGLCGEIGKAVTVHSLVKGGWGREASFTATGSSPNFVTRRPSEIWALVPAHICSLPVRYSLCSPTGFQFPQTAISLTFKHHILSSWSSFPVCPLGPSVWLTPPYLQVSAATSLPAGSPPPPPPLAPRSAPLSVSHPGPALLTAPLMISLPTDGRDPAYRQLYPSSWLKPRILVRCSAEWTRQTRLEMSIRNTDLTGAYPVLLGEGGNTGLKK